MQEIKSIGVLGLGYVGLPLALLAEEKGFRVFPIDVSKKKLESLNSKKPVIDDEAALNQLKKSKLSFTDDFSLLQKVDATIICVPTPVDKDKKPDISLVENAVISSAKQMKNGSVIIVESTINPGVCDEIVIPAIEKNSKHKVGKTIYVAHCPERINPGDPKWHVGNINRVLGADSEKGLELAYGFYSKLISAKVKKMDSLMEAEACKIVENSFRDVNIAFVNELAMSFSKLGININNVIDGAATKPFAFMAHYPGIGVGGHCIPVDPYYLIEYAKKKGFNHRFLTLARDINESMPIFSIDELERELISVSSLTLAKSSVLVLGISYKPNVADDRESPAYRVIDELKKRGAKVTAYDPYMLEKSDAQTLSEAVKNKDAIILVTGHDEFKQLNQVADLARVKVILDGRNSLRNIKDSITKNGTSYIGIGN